VTKRARHAVERLHHTTGGLFHPRPKEGQDRVTSQTLIQKQRKPKRATESKRTAQKNPEGVIPFHGDEGKEKDEGVLRHF